VATPRRRSGKVLAVAVLASLPGVCFASDFGGLATTFALAFVVFPLMMINITAMTSYPAALGKMFTWLSVLTWMAGIWLAFADTNRDGEMASENMTLLVICSGCLFLNVVALFCKSKKTPTLDA